jgi:hypothetical protein
MDVLQGSAVGELVDEIAVEEVDGETAVFVDVVTMGVSGAVVGVAGVADGEDEGAARA